MFAHGASTSNTLGEISCDGGGRLPRKAAILRWLQGWFRSNDTFEESPKRHEIGGSGRHWPQALLECRVSWSSNPKRERGRASPPSLTLRVTFDSTRCVVLKELCAMSHEFPVPDIPDPDRRQDQQGVLGR
jgi:hypothetical protein